MPRNKSNNSNKSGNSSRNQRNKGKGTSTKAPVIPESEVKKRNLDNDPNWYFTDPVVADQATQLSFNRFLGSSEDKLGNYAVPTIMTIQMNPCPGNTYPMWAAGTEAASVSGFNMAMTKLYNRLSMKSGRNMSYAPQDLGMMYLAQGELVSLITHVRRAFAIAQTYNQRNRMFPKKMIAALGFEPEDFFQEFSNYRMRFNTLLASVNQIPIMSESGYMRKCNAIYGGLYMDSNNSMSQIYAFVPCSTWMLDEMEDERGTMLKTTWVNKPETGTAKCGKIWNFDNFMDTILEPMVAKLLTSSTLNLIYADMLNLTKYENLSFAQFAPVQDTDILVPEYNEMILKQIHNLTCFGIPQLEVETDWGTHYNDVVSDPDRNWVKYSPAFLMPNLTGDLADGLEVILDTDTDQPDMTERIEMVRYTSALSNSWVTSGNLRWNVNATLPDHYASYLIIYDCEVNEDHANRMVTVYNGDFNLASAYQLSQFDWHPTILDHKLQNGLNVIDKVCSDLGYYTTVTAPYLRRVNQIIFMGLFEIRG